MRPISPLLLSALLAVLFATAPAFAHHGFASYTRDMTTVQATITDYRFINPHVQLYFDIENEAGEIEHWQGELTAPNRLARAGWTKNTFKPGDKIQISGELAQNGGHSIRIREIINADGDQLPLRESVD